MCKDNFNEWLDNLVKENDIDILETYIIKKRWKKSLFNNKTNNGLFKIIK